MPKAKPAEKESENTEAPAPAAKPTPVAAVEKNGITRPRSVDSQTGKVWVIADFQSAKLKRPATRKEVLAVASNDGINPATCATQYGRWRKFNGLTGTGAETAADTTTDEKS